MSAPVLFHMWRPHRKFIIEKHKFYLNQARSRLLSQFGNIESEAEKAGADWLERASHNFDPERDCPSDIYEAAEDESISFYQLLTEMRDSTRLSVVAGLYHEMEKQLRDWMEQEINRLHVGDEVREQIWRQTFEQRIGFFALFDWKIQSKPYYTKLNACHLVVNVYKHGEGASFKQLKLQYPEYIQSDVESNLDFMDYADLKVSELQIDEFSASIVDFWNDVPERISCNSGEELPKWFQNALQKDLEKIESFKKNKN
jgi:hypothetical protein